MPRIVAPLTVTGATISWGERQSLVAKAAGLLSRTLRFRLKMSRTHVSSKLEVPVSCLYRYRMARRPGRASISHPRICAAARWPSTSVLQGRVHLLDAAARRPRRCSLRFRAAARSRSSIFAMYSPPWVTTTSRSSHGRVRSAQPTTAARSRPVSARATWRRWKTQAVGLAMAPTIRSTATTLDSFFANRPHGPDFLKIDVEGHELAVLNGALKMLRNIDRRFCSNAKPGIAPTAMLASFQSALIARLRRQFFLAPSSAYHSPIRSRRAPTAGIVAPRLFARGYVNNFAFVHRG